MRSGRLGLRHWRPTSPPPQWGLTTLDTAASFTAAWNPSGPTLADLIESPTRRGFAPSPPSSRPGLLRRALVQVGGVRRRKCNPRHRLHGDDRSLRQWFGRSASAPTAQDADGGALPLPPRTQLAQVWD